MFTACTGNTDTTDEEDITNETNKSYQTVSAETAKTMMDTDPAVIIVDVRTPDEYANGHIPEAILIDSTTVGTTPPALLPDLESTILVYCRSGNRSAQVAAKLAAMGYTKVYDFGGINNWPYEKVIGAWKE